MSPRLAQGEVAQLISVLGSARERGFLGPAPIEDQLHRSMAFAAVLDRPMEMALDLGSGGGLPGLVLSIAFPATAWYLLDSSPKRAGWLRLALCSLDLEARCRVLCARAEDVAHTELRHAFEVVTARSFGPPAATAECAAAFLRLGGEIIVAEPPTREAPRWSPSGLALLGLDLESTEVVATPAGPVTLSRLHATTLCPQRFPRRVGAPFKRPLF